MAATDRENSQRNQESGWSSGFDDQDVCLDQATRENAYGVDAGCMIWFRPSEDGPVPVKLSNFVARIIEEGRIDDGQVVTIILTIEVKLLGSCKPMVVTVPSSDFAGMAWVSKHCGSGAIIEAGPSKKDHLRAAIQSCSRPRLTLAYGHLGWRTINGEEVYLHAGGAIGKSGFIPDITVEVAPPLSGFRLPSPPSGEKLRTSFNQVLRFLDIAHPTVTVPLFMAAFRAPLQMSRFMIHLVGDTGAYKSTMQALVQGFLGTEFEFDNLPGSWLSSAPALTYLAYQAKDAPFMIDDLAPQPSHAASMKVFQVVEEFIRASGNGGGRDRCDDRGILREVRFPRGLGVSSGEELPKGFSARARVLIITVRRENISLSTLSEVQSYARAGVLSECMSAYIQWLACHPDLMGENFRRNAQALRSEFHASHGRTTMAATELYATSEIFLQFAQEHSAITEAEVLRFREFFKSAIRTCADLQERDQALADPVLRFLDLLPSVLSSGRGHLESVKGGCPPNAHQFGWTQAIHGASSIDLKPTGNCLGWLDEAGEYVYLDPASAFAATQDLAKGTGEALGMAMNTLWERLDERNYLLRGDSRHRARKIPRRGNDRGIAIRVEAFPRWSALTDSHNSHLDT